MTPPSNRRFQAIAHNALRIAAGLAYSTHGAQKTFGWFGGFRDGGTAELFTRWGAAGIIEVVAGVAIALGLFTRPLALLAAGEMAVAYFWINWGGSGEMWWWKNRGELAMVYAFLWLFFAAWGPGTFSVDAWWQGLRAKRRDSTHGG